MKKNKRAIYSTKWIAYTALLMALVVVTSVIPPLPLGPYNVYWCDGAILLAAFLVNPVSAFLVGGLGSAIYDFAIGHAHVAVVSLIIHGLQGAVVSVLLHIAFRKFKREPIWAAVAGTVGALIVIGGYFLYYWAVAPLVLGGDKYGLEYAAVRVPRNIIQEIIGVTLAMLICYATTFKKQLKKNNLLPDFTGEMLAKKHTPEPEKEDEENIGETEELN